MRSVVVAAPAKVNLTLEVLGRRSDGYHELRSVLAIVDLADRVRVAPSAVLDVRIAPAPDVPAGDDLASRAVRALAAETGREPHAHVRIRKRIPVAAGLGGGSSDAGATLRALQALWRCDADLVRVAAEVGSDVPFFAAGAPFAAVSGRGEIVEPLPSPARAPWIVLVRVAARVPTAAVFAALAPEALSDGAATARLRRAFAGGRADATTLRDCATNDLEAAASSVCPAIADACARAAAEDIALSLSGSGPSLFAIADDERDALRVARALRRAGLRARPHRLGVVRDASERALGTYA